MKNIFFKLMTTMLLTLVAHQASAAFPTVCSLQSKPCDNQGSMYMCARPGWGGPAYCSPKDVSGPPRRFSQPLLETYVITGQGVALTDGGNCESQPISVAYKLAQDDAQSRCAGTLQQVGEPVLSQKPDYGQVWTCGPRTKTIVKIDFECH